MIRSFISSCFHFFLLGWFFQSTFSISSLFRFIFSLPLVFLLSNFSYSIFGLPTPFLYSAVFVHSSLLLHEHEFRRSLLFIFFSYLSFYDRSIFSNSPLSLFLFSLLNLPILLSATFYSLTYLSSVVCQPFFFVYAIYTVCCFTSLTFLYPFTCLFSLLCYLFYSSFYFCLLYCFYPTLL